MNSSDRLGSTNDETFRVFLSSTAEDLHPYRAVVLEALNRIDSVKTVNQESFGARGGRTVDECRRLVASSHVVVVVVAHRYGWVPTKDEGGDGKLSITALELEAARTADPPLPVLAFVLNGKHAWAGPSEQDALVDAKTKEEALEVWHKVQALQNLKRQLNSLIRETFETEGDLVSKVTTAVVNELNRLRAQRLDAQLPSLDQGASRPTCINFAPASAPAHFQEREKEAGRLRRFLGDDATRVVTVVGRVGSGKATLVCQILGELQSESSIDGMVYLGKESRHGISAANLFSDLTKLLPKDSSDELRSLYRNPNASTESKFHRLADHFRSGIVVVLMSGFEQCIDPNTRTVVDTELEQALASLLTRRGHTLKVILTTRLAPDAPTKVNPAALQRLQLGDGLPYPAAKKMLQDMDEDGVLDADEEQLETLWELTRGNPLALEKVFYVLRDDLDTSVEQVIADMRRREAGNPTEAPYLEDVMMVLIGKEFSHLDEAEQVVMRVLAICPAPVSAAAVEYMSQPIIPDVDASELIKRLVNRLLVRREGRRYALHSADRSYVLTQFPAEEAADEDESPSPSSRRGLLRRGAEFFRLARKPSSEWKEPEDLNAQLVEFEFRVGAAEYITAFEILRQIDYEYLMAWGLYRQVADLHRRLRRHLPVAQQIESLNRLGHAFKRFGRPEESTGFLEQAIELAKSSKDRRAEGRSVAGLGQNFMHRGRFDEAIELLERAVDLAVDTTDPQYESFGRGQLGDCYLAIGRTAEATEQYTKALGIDQEVGNERYQAGGHRNLGLCLVALGDTDQALERYKKGLQLARKIDYKRGIAVLSYYTAYALLDRSEWDEAISLCHEALDIADSAALIQEQNRARGVLALAHLFNDDLAKAQSVIEEARQFDFPMNNHNVQACAGVIAIRRGDSAAARRACSETLSSTASLLESAPMNYEALDARGIALASQVLLGSSDKLNAGRDAFAQARNVTRDAGTVRATLRLYDALAAADDAGLLDGMRGLVAPES